MYTLSPPLAAYPYVQYNSDDDIVAFFRAYNSLAQEYVDFFNTYNLADFNSLLISGALLDWCAEGIYGFKRPFIVIGEEGVTYGPYGLMPYGFTYYGELYTDTGTATTYYFVDDDTFRRVMTWNFFKGDGNLMNIEWLKRRVMRFLTGENYPQEEYDVSLVFSGGNAVTIEIPSSYALADTLDALVSSNIVQLPFQYNFSVSVV